MSSSNNTTANIGVSQQWSEISKVALTEESIRSLHQPEDQFKIYVNSYENGQQFAIKAGHDFILYILAGACKTSIDGKECRLKTADFVTLAAGSYAFEILGTDNLEVVRVFSRA